MLRCLIVDGVSRRNNHAERQGEPVLPLSAERAYNLRAPAPQGPGALIPHITLLSPKDRYNKAPNNMLRGTEKSPNSIM